MSGIAAHAYDWQNPPRARRGLNMIQPAEIEAELLAFCRQHLADFKRPKKIHIVDAIPRTATGKIQRRVVAETFAMA